VILHMVVAMKIALFVHCFFPDHFYGTETYTLQLAQGLQTRGYEVTVVACIFAGEPKQNEIVTRYKHAGVSVVAIDKNYQPHSRILETYWHEAMRPHLARVLDEIRPDLVHVTHLLNHTAVLLEETRARGIPLVATLTDFFGFCYNNRLEAADGGLCVGPNLLRSNCIACHLRAVDERPAPRFGYATAGLRMRAAYALGQELPPDTLAMVDDIVARPEALFRAYTAYDAMIAPTEFLRTAYVNNGFDSHRMHLSRFGVDLDRRPKPVRTAGQKLVVGYIGQIAPHKGVDLLLRAAASLPPGQVELRIYGDRNSGYMARLGELAPPGTAFLGTFPSAEMASILARIDLLAIPSTWYENSPLVLLNALASHTPVLISNVQGMTEFVTEGREGWSFKRGDLADLQRVLGHLAGDPERVWRASTDVSYDRTTQSMGDDVDQVYGAVMARLHRGAA
jgi:glycosyltransferase involved in cell wall biosynthesis